METTASRAGRRKTMEKIDGDEGFFVVDWSVELD
jgi:hypothetical protein